jgi:hypothetical protein
MSCNATEQAETVPWVVKALSETCVFWGVVNKCDNNSSPKIKKARKPMICGL